MNVVSHVQRACCIYWIHPGPSKSALWMATRVNPHFQGMGLVYYIQYRAMQVLASHGIERVAASAIYGNSWRTSWSKLQEKFEFVERRRWVS